MQSFQISTSQNVSINYELAGVGDRILATAIDLVIKLGYSMLVYAVFFDTLKHDRTTWVFALFFIPVLLYTLLFETFMEGQTPGKRIRKIKIVKLDGSPAGFSSYLLRWLFSIIEANPFVVMGGIGILTMMLTKLEQRIGDILGGTTAIKVQDSLSLKDTLYKKVNSNYTAVYNEAKKLTSEDIELVNKVLNTPAYRNNFEMVYSLTNKIQEKMEVSRTEGPEDFLETIVKDYNHLCDE